jgi:hypothetical protein
MSSAPPFRCLPLSYRTALRSPPENSFGLSGKKQKHGGCLTLHPGPTLSMQKQSNCDRWQGTRPAESLTEIATDWQAVNGSVPTTEAGGGRNRKTKKTWNPKN